jgi:hypothetical protein
MPETNRRVLVEGVEFGHVFRFPRILPATLSALHLPRLAIALLVVCAVITAGRIWDGLDAPSVSPNGLLAGPRTDADQVACDAALRSALDLFMTVEQTAALLESGPLETRRVVEAVRASFEAQSPEADPQVLATRRAALIETLASIERLRPRGTFESLAATAADCYEETVRGVIDLRITRVLAAAGVLLIDAPRALWRDHPWFTVVFGLISLLALSFGGGAIARMAAFEAAEQQRLTLREAVDFAVRHWISLVMAPLTPVLFAAGLGLIVFALSFIFMNVPVLDVIGGAGYGVALAIGFAIAFLLVGYLFALPMLLPAIACERCDAFDAQQRAYAYVVSRPLHLVGYALVGLLGAAIGFMVVAFFASTMLNITAWLVGLGQFADSTALADAGGFGVFTLGGAAQATAHVTWHETWAAGLIGFWQTVIVSLVISYVLSHFFSASTVLYLLMRNVCDGRPVQEIVQDDGVASGAVEEE